jgi:hypothetical protein
VFFQVRASGDRWLVQENIPTVEQALAIRAKEQRYRDGVPPDGELYLLAPSSSWPRCPSCTYAMIVVEGVAVCVTDLCPHSTSPDERAHIRRVVRGLCAGGRR